jgi:transposase
MYRQRWCRNASPIGEAQDSAFAPIEPAGQAIAAAGASILYLPPYYSPDFNPIEQLFASLKTLLREAPARARTSSGTARRVRQLPQPLRLCFDLN